MTDKEIINAMLACSIKGNCPSDCPYQIDYDINSIDGCMSAIISDALDLINRQQAEIEMLKKVIENDNEIIAELEEQNEIEIADGGASCHLCLKVHTDKAIKEFAKKLKEDVEYHINDIGDFVPYVEASYIDNLVKEMAGADNG